MLLSVLFGVLAPGPHSQLPASGNLTQDFLLGRGLGQEEEEEEEEAKGF